MTDAAASTAAAPAGQAADAAAAAAAAPTPAAPAATPAAPATPAAAAAAAPTPAAPAAPAAGTPAGDLAAATDAASLQALIAADPAKAAASILALRQENATERVNGKTAAAEDARKALAADLIKFLDPSANAEDATPEALTAKLTETNARADNSERRLSVVEAAWGQGIDPSKLAFVEFQLSRDPKLAAIAHNSPEWGASLTAAIQALTSADPSIKTPGAVTTTGAEGFAGSNGTEAVTKAQFDAMSLDERTKLYRSDKATYDRLVNS